MPNDPKEMNELLDAYPAGGDEPSEPVEPAEPVEPTPVEPAEPTEPSKDEPTEPATVAEPEPEPEPEPKPDKSEPVVDDDDIPLEQMEPAELAKLVIDLRSQISDAAAGSFFKQTAEPGELPEGKPKETPGAAVAEPTPAPKPKAEWENKDFLGETPIDQFLDDRSKFNELLNAVAKTAFEQGASVDPVAIRTDVLRGVPEVVGKFVSGMLAMRTMANEFYETNPDLRPYKNLVAAAANNLSAQHPDWTMAQVMSESAVIARKTLGLRNKAISRKSGETPPTTRPGGARKVQTPTMTGVQKEIDEIINLE